MSSDGYRSPGIPGLAGGLFGWVIVLVVMNVVLCVLRDVPIAAIRIIGSLLGYAAQLLLLWWIGRGVGREDARRSEMADKRAAQGVETDEKNTYRLTRPLCVCLIVFLVPLALGIYVALTASGAAVSDAPTVRDWIRAAARLFVLPMINFFPDIEAGVRTIDLLTPAAMLLYPAAYLAGYTMGPAAWKKLSKENARAKRKARRKAERGTGIWMEGQVHYGYAPKGEKKDKNSLI